MAGVNPVGIGLFPPAALEPNAAVDFEALVFGQSVALPAGVSMIGSVAVVERSLNAAETAAIDGGGVLTILPTILGAFGWAPLVMSMWKDTTIAGGSAGGFWTLSYAGVAAPIYTSPISCDRNNARRTFGITNGTNFGPTTTSVQTDTIGAGAALQLGSTGPAGAGTTIAKLYLMAALLPWGP